jgi:hypothetical protein
MGEALTTHYSRLAFLADNATRPALRPTRSPVADDLEAGVKGALFKLTEIAPAYLRLVCEIVLRKPFRVAKTAQVEGKHFPQVHARSEPTCSQYAPRYTEQNPGWAPSQFSD